jgi:hypothetical protein
LIGRSSREGPGGDGGFADLLKRGAAMSAIDQVTWQVVMAVGTNTSAAAATGSNPDTPPNSVARGRE